MPAPTVSSPTPPGACGCTLPWIRSERGAGGRRRGRGRQDPRGARRARLSAHRIGGGVVLAARAATGPRSWRPSPPREHVRGRPGAAPGAPLGRRRATPTSLRMAIGGVALAAAGFAPLRVRPPAAARPDRPPRSPPAPRSSPATRSCAARCARCAADSRAGHRRSGLGRHRRQPGPARERGRADRAVAAQHRRVPAGSDPAAHPPRDLGPAAAATRTPPGSGSTTAPRSRSPIDTPRRSATR